MPCTAANAIILSIYFFVDQLLARQVLSYSDNSLLWINLTVLILFYDYKKLYQVASAQMMHTISTSINVILCQVNVFCLNHLVAEFV